MNGFFSQTKFGIKDSERQIGTYILLNQENFSGFNFFMKKMEFYTFHLHLKC
jgi:hypothetical protein